MSKGKNTSGSDKAVLIYDGSCPVCSNTIEWIKEHEQEGSFEMLPCQAEERKKRYPAMDEATCMEAMQLVLPGGSVFPGEKALPEIFKRLRRYRAAAGLFTLPGANSVARIFYRWFAHQRYHIAKVLYPEKKDGRGRDKKAV